MEARPEKQRQILEFIKDTHAQTGIFPTIREIAEFMGFKSTNTVDYHLRRLELSGALERGGKLARTFRVPDMPSYRKGKGAKSLPIDIGIPVVGRVAAGAPILAEQNYDGLINFRNIFHCDERTYALRVEGDSMIEAGIVDGDLVIVRQQPRVNNGEIGVAVIENEATVKRVYEEKDHWRLEPENKTMRPMKVDKARKDFAIAGKVIGVLRKI